MQRILLKQSINITVFCIALISLVPSAIHAQTTKDVSTSRIFREMQASKQQVKSSGMRRDTATFAAGCYWCVEAQYKELNGVDTVISGFTGGTTPNPTYEQVAKGTTGYAEACNVIYDPSKISYTELLAAFFVVHDPTQLNRQGDEIGTEYRSAIFYHNAEQKKLSEYYIKRLNEEKVYPTSIVTQVQPYTIFYKAGKNDQNYYAKNPIAPYCTKVIQPKLDRFKKVFQEKLKR